MLPTTTPGARSLADVLPNSLLSLRGEQGSLRLPQAESSIVVVVDGLGTAQLTARSGHARFLSSRLEESIASVFPTTTAAALASLMTGVLPGQHGLVGYRVLDAASDRVVNQLTGWDAAMAPATWQRAQTVFERALASDAGVRSYAVGPASFARSGFTQAILRGAEYRSADDIAARFSEAARLAGTPGALIYLYVPELDKAAHRYGWESDEWLARLETLDGVVRGAASSLPRRTGMLVTADHGTIDVPYDSQIVFDVEPQLIDGVRHVGGEPRCVQLYLEPGASEDDRRHLASLWRQSEGERAWVLTRDEAIAAGLFGTVEPEIAARIGDVIVAARTRVVYYDSRSPEPAARKMIGQHGSLSEEERIVPLIRLGVY